MGRYRRFLRRASLLTVMAALALLLMGMKSGEDRPPELFLAGDTVLKLQLGQRYEEPGYTATDTYGGDLTDAVRVSGSCNIYMAGTYKLVYSVTDLFGNTAQCSRTVIVEAAQIPDPKKVIYLTFDDGPSKYTPKLLKTLRKYGVKATFFVVNNDFRRYMDDIVSDGHTIALHTDSHRYDVIYVDEKAYFHDLEAIHSQILAQTGVDTMLMRFPGGSSNTIYKRYCRETGLLARLKQAVQEKGLKYFDWNVDSGDASTAKNADDVYANVIAGIKAQKGSSVVLQHDTCGFSVDAVERIIQWALENGYTFLALNADSPGVHHWW